MPVNLSTLKTELLTDPVSLGYNALSNHGTLAALLNNVSALSATLSVTSVNPEIAQAAVVGSEYAGLTAVQRDAWGAIVGLPFIPVSSTNIRQQITSIWSAGTTTRANLVELQTRRCTRAEQLFGEGVIIHHLDVAAALGLPA